jgi:hypothetical protein
MSGLRAFPSVCFPVLIRTRRRPTIFGAVRELDSEPRAEDLNVNSPSPDATSIDEDGTATGVLRWLLGETEAESAAYLRLPLGGQERLLIEPRGLPALDVGYLAHQVRHAIVAGTVDPDVNEPVAFARWLGPTGSKILVLRGVTSEAAREPLRFARFVIEWSSMAGASGGSPVEQRIRMIPGVAWTEYTEEGGDPTLRVLMSGDADREGTRRAVDLATTGSGVAVTDIETMHKVSEEPRARLIDLTVNLEDHPSVDVVIEWKGQRLRGRGHGRATSGGRSYASAEAVADAMKPLLDTDVVIEGLYEADASDGLNVLVAAVRVGGERFVGAVVAEKGDEDVSGARAVLDALNRRLPQIAGKQGRI